jgi:hypothetical protein
LAKLPQIPDRLVKIDALTRLEHYHLTADDDCYFLWEWDAAPYAESATTDFIGNFQRDPKFRDRYWPWLFKNQAMRHAAAAICQTILPEWESSVFVPVPPSKVKGDPRHDSRLMDTLRFAGTHVRESRELILQVTNSESRQKDFSPSMRAHNWTINLSSLAQVPQHVVVFDDLLTGGSHFAAMKIVLARKLQGVPVSGLFLARRVLASQTADPRA